MASVKKPKRVARRQPISARAFMSARRGGVRPHGRLQLPAEAQQLAEVADAVAHAPHGRGLVVAPDVGAGDLHDPQPRRAARAMNSVSQNQPRILDLVEHRQHRVAPEELVAGLGVVERQVEQAPDEPGVAAAHQVAVERTGPGRRRCAARSRRRRPARWRARATGCSGSGPRGRRRCSRRSSPRAARKPSLTVAPRPWFRSCRMRRRSRSGWRATIARRTSRVRSRLMSSTKMTS